MEPRLIGSLRLHGPPADRASFDAALEYLWPTVRRPCGWYPSADRLEWNWCNGDAESCLWYLEQLAENVFWPRGVTLSGSFSLVNRLGECMMITVLDGGAQNLGHFYKARYFPDDDVKPVF
jgi:hypothetical protein